MPPDSNFGYLALNVTDEQITVPALSSVVISFGTQEPTDREVVIEGDEHLRLSRHMCVAQDIAELHHGTEKVMLTNLRHKYTHLI